MTIDQQNILILQSLREAFPDSGFIVIRTDYLEQDKQTEITYASSLDLKDTKRVLNGTFLMCEKKMN